MIELVEFLLLGTAVGTVGSLLGLGGGFILVPLFMLFFMPPGGSTFETVQQVVGTSLFVVLCNSLSGTWAYVRQKRIFMRAAVPFAAATVPGAFLGGYISEWFSGASFSITFGVMMMALGVFMAVQSRGKRANASAVGFDAAGATVNMPLGVGCSFLVGFVSSILGIGGGIIHVPMMVFLLGFPPHVAVATSTFVLMVSAVIGVTSHALLAHIVWGPAVMIGIGAVAGAQIGAKIAGKSRPRYLVVALACIMFALGIEFLCKGALG